MDSTSASIPLSWVQKIWSIKRFELKKIFAFLLLKFLVSMVYAILTCMKDTLVVTANHSGAEVIPILKGWVIFPISILCAVSYAKLRNHFKRSTLFYAIISTFLVIIFCYAFFLYPHSDLLSPHKSAQWLTERLGAKYSHWIAVYLNWIPSLFFVTAELWGQIVIFILFWGLANQICKIKEAKRIYIFFIAAGDLGTIVAGPLTWYYVTKTQNFTLTLQILMSYALLAGLLILALYWWIGRYVLTDKRYDNPESTKERVNSKTKLTLTQSFKHIFSSKYLLSIAVLVIGCALTINIVEVTWKAHLKILYPTPEAYQAFMAKLTFLVGLVALITVLFLGGNFLRLFGWRFSAQIAPITIGATGVIFFILCLFKEHLSPFTSLFGITPLVFVVFFGAFQNIISKVAKYSFFDSTKEMAYIPLDNESKEKGKAAIDVVGSRFGKSSSSWIQIFFIQIVGTGSILSTTPYLLPILLGVCAYWLYSVRYLGRELDGKEKRARETPIKDPIGEPELSP